MNSKYNIWVSLYAPGGFAGLQKAHVTATCQSVNCVPEEFQFSGECCVLRYEMQIQTQPEALAAAARLVGTLSKVFNTNSYPRILDYTVEEIKEGQRKGQGGGRNEYRLVYDDGSFSDFEADEFMRVRDHVTLRINREIVADIDRGGLVAIFKKDIHLKSLFGSQQIAYSSETEEGAAREDV